MPEKVRCNLLAASKKTRSVAAPAKLDEIRVAERADQLLTPCGRSVGIEFSREDQCWNAADYSLILFRWCCWNIPGLADGWWQCPKVETSEPRAGEACAAMALRSSKGNSSLHQTE
jgi:hypothetical protein